MFDTERFIAEVEKRPAIYDVNSDDYGDKNGKVRAWLQVCEIMTPKWHLLSDEDKDNEEKILRSKWRNIRDYFIKEVKLMKKAAPNGRKRKKYTYFDQLLFLLPTIENKQRNHRHDYPTRCKSEEKSQEADEMMDEYEMAQSVMAELRDDEYLTPEQYSKSICETSLAAASTSSEFADASSVGRLRDDDDYDRMFLLSLLPIMRRVPEEKKLDVRIQMQQALATALRNSNA